jgi:rubrerythrin
MANTSYTIGDLIELAIALERSNESYYRGLQEKFSHSPDVREFWQAYADEEDGHARWLEQLRERVKEKLSTRLEHPHLVEVAQRLLKITPEEHLSRVNNLDEGYHLAVELENSETNTIFEFLILNYSLTAQAANFLQAQLHSHIKRLMDEFPPGFRSRARRLAVQARE